MSDARLFKLVGVVTLSVLALFAFDAWRVNRSLKARGGKGYPIVATTGIYG